jgi:hypothetical protein
MKEFKFFKGYIPNITNPFEVQDLIEENPIEESIIEENVINVTNQFILDLNEEFNSDEYLSVDKCIYHCTTLQMDTIQIYYKDIDTNEYVINIYESQTFEVSRLEYRNNIAQFDYNFRLSEEFKSDVNNIMNIIRYTPRRLFSYHL